MPDKQPFAKQAALVCLLAPIIAIAMNLLTGNAVAKEAGWSLFIGIISSIFVLASPVFGIIALAGIPRHGAKGILIRSLVGMALSAALIGAGLIALVLASRGRMSSIDDLKLMKPMLGTWELRAENSSGATVTWLRLSKDRAFEFRTTGAAVAQFSGTWSVQNSRLYLTVEDFVAGKRKTGGKRIVWPIAQVAPDKLVLATADRQVTYRRLPSADVKTLGDLESEYQAQYVGMFVYPTWLGTVEANGGRVTVSSLDDRAQFTREFRSFFETPASLLQLTVDNRSGTGPVVVNPASVKLYSGERLVAEAPPPAKILATAKKDREKWLAKYSGNVTVPAGKTSMDRLLLLPFGTSLTEVTHVTLEVNGAETSVPGRLLAPEEFKQMYQRGRELQTGM